MGRERHALLPRYQRGLATTGENLRLARLRRQLSSQQVAERAGISRTTLGAIERGAPGCSIGNVMQVLAVLGLAEDWKLLGKSDSLGHRLSDARLTESRQRAPRRQ